jgi:hypothetical protein
MKKYTITIALIASVLVAGAQRLPLDRLKPWTITELDSIKSRNYKREYNHKRLILAAQKIQIEVNHILASEWDSASGAWYNVPNYHIKEWKPRAFQVVRKRYLNKGIRIRRDGNIFGFRKL